MGTLMSSLTCVLLELNLYIVLAASLSVFGQNNNHLRHETQLRPGDNSYQYRSDSLEAALKQAKPSQSDVALRDNKMDDLFLENPSSREHADTDAQAAEQHKRLKQFVHLPAYNSISLENSLEVEPEMLTNNHQLGSFEVPAQANTSTGGPGSGQNSRHYNSYQAAGLAGMASSNALHPNHKHPSHFGKYASPTMFANNLNLNYIHGFLAGKPSMLSALGLATSSSAPPKGGSVGITDHYGHAAQPGHQSGGNFVSTYISASSALSAAVNNLQHSIAQKQQQLSSIQSQLQSLAAVSGPSPYAPFSGGGGVTGAHSSVGNKTNDDRYQGDASRCGRQQVAFREPRVVGGNSTYEGEFPWAVSIQRHSNHHCGGVIVDRRWILTAAHCVRSQLVGNLAVRTGGHTLTRSPNAISGHLERDYQVEQIFMHDDFSRYDNLTASQSKSSANTNNADIALLKLKQDINWNDLAWPVCFPSRDAGNFSGHDAIVVGWGKLNEKSEEFSNELQKVKLTIIDNKVCQNWFRQAGRDMPIDERIICAGFKHGGKDACHGDSGGPLLSRVNGQYVVVGVVSTGIGCARPLLPGLYSRVSSYVNWIERHIVS